MGSARVIVDASAILAVLLKEPEEQQFFDILAEARAESELSPVNFLEIALRVDRDDMPETSANLLEILKRMNVRVTSVNPEQAYLAREAYQRFGKRNYPARLSLGDCFAYALAKARGEPLLFKGDNFRQTDVEAAL